MDYAANLAHFLQDKTGSVLGSWRGHMSAKNQRALFGQFLGKGKITINGQTETVVHSVKRCFGLDFEVTANLKWRDLH